ncbi:MAG TPA: hypothetical protein VFG23_09455 [Polyangia bacterium]|nr:hypothetical protein [Polyangia bacterium]
MATRQTAKKEVRPVVAARRVARPLTREKAEEMDRLAPFPILRQATRDMAVRSLSSPGDARLRDAARVLNAVELALIRGDSGPLDLLAAAAEKAFAKDVAWTMPMSLTLAPRRLPARKRADAPRAFNNLLGVARFMLRGIAYDDVAYSGHRERLDRFIVNAPIGAS